MSNTLSVSPGQLTYCVECADVYGTIGANNKRCACPASQHLERWQGGDFATPFEICWYCQAAIVRSGSKWSTYFCDECRPAVIALNDALDGASLVSLPIGRHSLHHRWRHARPFASTDIVDAWKRRRLRQAWSLYASEDRDWFGFVRFIQEAFNIDGRLENISLLVQDSRDDFLFECISEVNRELQKHVESALPVT